MSETISEERVYKSQIFSDWVNGTQGEAGRSLKEVIIDSVVRHPDWPTPAGAQRMVRRGMIEGDETMAGIYSYGYCVYREFLEEEPPIESVHLDPRVFLDDTDLIDVLAEAAYCAIDDGRAEFVLPFFNGMLDLALAQNFADHTMRKYLTMVMESGNIGVIKTYVKFINEHTVKGPDDSKEFLKKMAHSVAKLPVSNSLHPGGIGNIEKVELLESIGYAWIRKSMPVAEIDWLP